MQAGLSGSVGEMEPDNHEDGCEVEKRTRKRSTSEVRVAARWTASRLGVKEGVQCKITAHSANPGRS